MRVLVVRIGAMGDVLHAMPAVAALRERHPDWFIAWAIEPRWSDLLQMQGDFHDLSQGVGPAARALIDRWYSVPTRAWKRNPFSRATISEIAVLRRVLKDGRFDVCVDMQGALKSAMVGRMAGAAVFAGPEEPRERLARRLYKTRIAVTAAHVVEQGCELLGAAIGELLQPRRVPLPMDEADELWADEVSGKESFALIAPSAGWGAKMWPPDRFGAVAAGLGQHGLPTLVNAAAAGDEVADAVVRSSEGWARAVPSSVGQLIALVRRAAVVIAGDTGPLHLAAALERPLVGIYGPTDPARNGPWATRVRVLRSDESVTSHKREGEAEAAMLQISVEDVLAAALEMLG